MSTINELPLLALKNEMTALGLLNAYNSLIYYCVWYLILTSQSRDLTIGWLVVLGFNATLTVKVISWRSVTHLCFLAFSHQY